MEHRETKEDQKNFREETFIRGGTSFVFNVCGIYAMYKIKTHPDPIKAVKRQPSKSFNFSKVKMIAGKKLGAIAIGWTGFIIGNYLIMNGFKSSDPTDIAEENE